MNKNSERKSERSPKGANGSADSIVIHLDPSDPSEARALQMSKLLAVKHGRRKQIIVTLLEAMQIHMEQTGKILSGGEIAAAILAHTNGTAHVTSEIAAARPAYRPPLAELPPKPARMSKAEQEENARKTAEMIAANYSKGMSTLFE